MHYGWENSILKAFDHNLSKWLTSQGNLTQKLKYLGVHDLTLLTEGMTPLPEEECQLLKQSSQQGYTRHILHYLNHQICICARTIVSHAFYQKYKTAFDNLGTKPLGKTILYNNHNIKRSHFEYGIISPQSFLTKHFPLADNNAMFLAARRSIFSDGQDYLCLIEIFLPLMNNYEIPC